MPDQLLGPFIRRFLVEDIVLDRNLTPNTQKSYRDTFSLLLSFVSGGLGYVNVHLLSSLQIVATGRRCKSVCSYVT